MASWGNQFNFTFIFPLFLLSIPQWDVFIFKVLPRTILILHGSRNYNSTLRTYQFTITSPCLSELSHHSIKDRSEIVHQQKMNKREKKGEMTATRRIKWLITCYVQFSVCLFFYFAHVEVQKVIDRQSFLTLQSRRQLRDTDIQRVFSSNRLI